MMMSGNNGQLSVPPGFRFHPTEEELLYYYLRKKVLCEAIDLDVIREVDLNKLEPWDLKEKCRIGSSGPPQNEWYFFSHKDKKYPTGTRTNRATTAGFWKATGRDKAISNSNKRIGMRKTLVFYTGRAPHGQKTDWIMHEYRLLDENDVTQLLQEDGWVVCRVFKKKSTTHHERELAQEMENYGCNMKNPTGSPHHQSQNPQPNYYSCNNLDVDEGGPTSMHLPQLLNSDSLALNPTLSTFMPPFSFNNTTNHHHHEHDHNLLNLLTSSNGCSSSNLGGGGLMMQQQPQERPFGGEYWSFLDKLLTTNNSSSASHQSQLMDQNHMMTMIKNHPTISLQGDHGHRAAESSTPFQRFPFHYLGGTETDHMLK